jgi:hypothetical protein
MPSNASLMFWIGVLGCFLFWLVAYVLIIWRGFQDKTFGMPIAALCANIAWEILFSNYYVPDYRLVRFGNALWVLFDIAILIAAWKYGPDDFAQPLMKRFLRPLIVVGIFLSAFLAIPFVEVYQDRQGYLLGWIAAFMMSILFVAMLLRRDSLRGQSFYIGLAMLLGNFSAFLWVKHYPHQVLDPIVNLTFMLATGLFNVIYIILIWEKCRSEGVNPLKRF